MNIEQNKAKILEFNLTLDDDENNQYSYDKYEIFDEHNMREWTIYGSRYKLKDGYSWAVGIADSYHKDTFPGTEEPAEWHGSSFVSLQQAADDVVEAIKKCKNRLELLMSSNKHEIFEKYAIEKR